MIFFLALNILIVGNTVYWLKAIKANARIELMLFLAVSSLGAIAFLCGIAGRSDLNKYTVVSFFLFGAGSAILFCWKLWQEKDQEAFHFWKMGLKMVVVASGLYISFTAIDHWTFFDTDNAGMINSPALELNQTCPNAMIFRIKEDMAQYRCPTLMILGRLHEKPFIPWPYYIEGESDQLKSAVDQLKRQAEQKD